MTVVDKPVEDKTEDKTEDVCIQLTLDLWAQEADESDDKSVA